MQLWHICDYTTVGVEYVRNNWTFAGEYFIQDGNTHIVAAPVLDQTGNYGTNSWYVSAARRLNAKWEVGGYYSFSENRYPGVTATKDAKQIGDWAISLRYDINEHLLIKAEATTSTATTTCSTPPRRRTRSSSRPRPSSPSRRPSASELNGRPLPRRPPP